MTRPKDPFSLDGAIAPVDRSKARIQILSLSGGGYRGLYTACVLEQLEAAFEGSIVDRFDVIAGTSVGGILAIGLAAGKAPASLKRLLLDHGKTIFKPRSLKKVQSLVDALYDPAPLSKAIKESLGEPLASLPMRRLAHPLIVVSISRAGARPHLFQSGPFGQEACDDSLLDAAMATSAAPTFFPAHGIGTDFYLDGGLIANAPDLVAALQVEKVFKIPLTSISMLSIGTAGASAAAAGTPPRGGYRWLNGGDLVNLTMEAQEELSVDLARRLLTDKRHLRIDRAPPPSMAGFLPMDAATDEATAALQVLARESVDDVLRRRGRRIAQLFSHRRHLMA